MPCHIYIAFHSTGVTRFRTKKTHIPLYSGNRLLRQGKYILGLRQHSFITRETHTDEILAISSKIVKIAKIVKIVKMLETVSDETICIILAKIVSVK